MQIQQINSLQACRLILLAMLCSLAGSFPSFCRAENPAGADATATPERVVFDIPRLHGITIDGDPSDWANQGLLISVLNSAAPRRLPIELFDAQFRIGWNERGLILLADVADPIVHESDSDVELGTGASLDAIIDARGGKEHWQASVSPGADPEHPQLRTHLNDDRSRGNRNIKISISAAARKTASGYIIEELLPWDTLSVDAKVGSLVGLQMWVNKADGRDSDRLGWFPRQLRLADEPSSVVTAAFDGGYDRMRHTRFIVAGDASSVGKLVRITAGDTLLGEAAMQGAVGTADGIPGGPANRGPGTGRITTAEITVPLPPVDKPYGPVVATLDGKRVDILKLRDADEMRRDAIDDLDVVAQAAVFAKRDLPTLDFYNPSAAEDLLGDYTLHTTYYDVDYNPVTSADRPGRYGAVVEVTPATGKPFKRYLTLYRQPQEMAWWPARVSAALKLPSQFGIDAAVASEQQKAAADFVGWGMSEDRWRDEMLALYLAGLSEIKPGAGNLPERLGPEGRNISWWYGLKKKIGALTPYPYLVHLPDPSASRGQAKFPLILFLHGSGERGDKLEDLKVNGPPKILKNDSDWEFKDQFIFISPQCPAGSQWNPLLLRDLLDEVSTKYPVDPNHIYLTGLSMGGFGTWQLAEWFPERFAAIAPMSGGGDPTDVARVKEIPAWVVHGAHDRSVNINNAYEMVQALRDIHGRIRFTVYADRGHNAWDPGYDNPALYRWFLQQRLGMPQQPRSATPDTRPADN